jgi:hypothetical protein
MLFEADKAVFRVHGARLSTRRLEDKPKKEDVLGLVVFVGLAAMLHASVRRPWKARSCFIVLMLDRSDLVDGCCLANGCSIDVMLNHGAVRT